MAAADPWNRELRDALGILEVRAPEDGRELFFTVWRAGFPEGGGCAKGYARLEELPSKLVHDIDGVTRPGFVEEKEFFRRIDRTWYIHYLAGTGSRGGGHAGGTR